MKLVVFIQVFLFFLIQATGQLEISRQGITFICGTFFALLAYEAGTIWTYP